MPEHSDIYLLLYRQTGSYKQITANKFTAPVVLKTLTKGMIIGDSADAPYLGFVKVLGVEHSIGFASGQDELHWHDAQMFDSSKYDTRRDELLNKIGPKPVTVRGRPVAPYRLNRWNERRKRTMDAYEKTIENQRNAFLNTHLPKHGEFTFTKMLDRATPQIAFGCSAQERFPVALFFYRRKIGLGLGAIRTPHFVIGLRKVRISAWHMSGDGESESVTLAYGDIAWAALGSIADSNMPLPIPTARMWDREANAGGETYSSSWAYGVEAIGLAMALIAGAAVKGIEAASGNGNYS